MIPLLAACLEPERPAGEGECKSSDWYYDGDADGFGAGDPVATCEALAGYVQNASDCDDADAAVGDGYPWYADGDADGFGAGDPVSSCAAPAGHVAEAGDCDDAAAAVNPDAPETCNDTDDDCDADVDEDPVDGATFYADADGDGFGTDTVLACSLAAGLAAVDGDCADDDAGRNPGADELCDEVDQDCDGTADENAIDEGTWYLDEDADGYGVSGVTDKLSCDAPDGYAPLAEDCDDADPAWHPGASESCDDPNDYNCDGSVGYADADGDGWAACVECDDGVAEVRPDAVEVCDGVDNDCDGTIDPDTSADAPSWYTDDDGDGHGTGAAFPACAAPAGTAAFGDDCDDADGTVAPGAAEACDASDTDCDGETRDAESTDATAWYADADGDGFGAGAATQACDAPSGQVDNDADCDDTRDDVSPDGSEACDPEDADEDCDGLADDDDTSPAGAGTVYADSDGDGFGDGAAVQLCDPSAAYATEDGDCDDADDAVSPDAAEICDDGIDQDCDGSAGACAFSAEHLYDDGDVLVSSTTTTNFGSIFAVIDADQDGVDDLVVGNNNSGTTVYGYDGPLPSGSITSADRSASGGNSFGRALDAAGDVDGDGFDDLLIAESEEDASVTNGGSVYLYGSVSGDFPGSASEFASNSSGAYCGTSVAGSGDNDGDDVPDVLIGCPYATPQAFGRWCSGAGFPSSCTTNLNGRSGESDMCGYNVAGLGDLDGDGYDELALNCTAGTLAGRTYMEFGPPTSGDLTSYGINILTANSGTGSEIVGDQDVDGDGYDDALLNKYESSSYSAVLFAGDAAGSLSATATFTSASGSLAGTAADLPGDLDGDGEGDVVLGASVVAASCGSAVGALVFYGPFSGAVSDTAAEGSFVTCSGYQPAHLDHGDLDDDGITDLVLGIGADQDVRVFFGGGT